MIQAATKRRQPLPEVIQNAPMLLPGLELYFNAYMELSTDRPAALGPSRIPWSSVDRWARRHRIDGEEEFDSLVAMIRAMDDAYFAWLEKKQPKGKPDGGRAAVSKDDPQDRHRR